MNSKFGVDSEQAGKLNPMGFSSVFLGGIDIKGYGLKAPSRMRMTNALKSLIGE
jgi:hypothetical protein